MTQRKIIEVELHLYPTLLVQRFPDSGRGYPIAELGICVKSEAAGEEGMKKLEPDPVGDGPACGDIGEGADGCAARASEVLVGDLITDDSCSKTAPVLSKILIITGFVGRWIVGRIGKAGASNINHTYNLRRVPVSNPCGNRRRPVRSRLQDSRNRVKCIYEVTSRKWPLSPERRGSRDDLDVVECGAVIDGRGDDDWVVVTNPQLLDQGVYRVEQLAAFHVM